MTEPTRLAKQLRSDAVHRVQFGVRGDERIQYRFVAASPCMVAVAQSAERLVVVQEVAGSTPVSHPIRLFRQDRALPLLSRLLSQHSTGTVPRRMEQTLTCSDDDLGEATHPASPFSSHDSGHPGRLTHWQPHARESPSHATPRLPSRPGCRNCRLPQLLCRDALSVPFGLLVDCIHCADLAFNLRSPLTDTITDTVAQPTPPSGRTTPTTCSHCGGSAHHRPAGERRQRRGHHHRRRRRLLSGGRLP